MVSERYHTVLGVVSGVSLFGLGIWGLQRSTPVSHVLFAFTAAFLSLGGASATVRARIPRYKRVSMLLLGILALLALLVGPESNALPGLLVVSLGYGVDTLVERVHHGEWLPTDGERPN
ncbi:hypothetical protein SAMN04487950_0044 [Halogranum rubrum]|uniref:Uncharacterized protein n=1 Tax=Halogranum rubrum TaxID=553466 RepID=A0A1I4ASY8_9EURY|nr:hypothetical protein [Halogranum rubrum]SFK58756.1 hypothetical protein SAMN04487950_0044 [Halogranum rubrum]